MTAADTALTGTIDYYFGVYGGNGYLVHDDADGVGHTDLIKLSGVTTFAPADLAAS